MNQTSALHLLLGTAVSVVLIGVPGGPAMGGGIASYLEADTTLTAVAIGTVVGLASAGAVAAFYAIVITVLIQPGVAYPILPSELTTTAFGILCVYSVTLGGIGGLVGKYVNGRRSRDETAV